MRRPDLVKFFLEKGTQLAELSGSVVATLTSESASHKSPALHGEIRYAFSLTTIVICRCLSRKIPLFEQKTFLLQNK